MTLRVPIRLLLVALLALPTAQSQPNSWKNVRYLGGSFPAKVNPFDWNTRLTVTGPNLEFVFAGRDKLTLPASSITKMAYGQSAHRRVAEMVALSFVATPLALFGILHKSKDHSLSIEFQDANAKPQILLLELHKSNYRVIISTLAAVSGQKVDNAPTP